LLKTKKLEITNLQKIAIEFFPDAHTSRISFFNNSKLEVTNKPVLSPLVGGKAIKNNNEPQ
jgi:hypothetical protein